MYHPRNRTCRSFLSSKSKRTEAKRHHPKYRRQNQALRAYYVMKDLEQTRITNLVNLTLYRHHQEYFSEPQQEIWNWTCHPSQAANHHNIQWN